MLTIITFMAKKTARPRRTRIAAAAPARRARASPAARGRSRSSSSARARRRRCATTGRRPSGRPQCAQAVASSRVTPAQEVHDQVGERAKTKKASQSARDPPRRRVAPRRCGSAAVERRVGMRRERGAALAGARSAPTDSGPVGCSAHRHGRSTRARRRVRSRRRARTAGASARSMSRNRPVDDRPQRQEQRAAPCRSGRSRPRPRRSPRPRP